MHIGLQIVDFLNEQFGPGLVSIEAYQAVTIVD